MKIRQEKAGKNQNKAMQNIIIADSFSLKLKMTTFVIV